MEDAHFGISIVEYMVRSFASYQFPWLINPPRPPGRFPWYTLQEVPSKISLSQSTANEQVGRLTMTKARLTNVVPSRISCQNS